MPMNGRTRDRIAPLHGQITLIWWANCPTLMTAWRRVDFAMQQWSKNAERCSSFGQGYNLVHVGATKQHDIGISFLSKTQDQLTQPFDLSVEVLLLA